MTNCNDPKPHGGRAPLQSGQALTAWTMTDPVETFYPGTARIMEDRVDYQFRNGFVDTGDLPCREAWLTQTTDLIDPLPADLAFTGIYCGTGADIDFSTFRQRPTLIRRFLATRLAAELATQASFTLETRGRVQVWAGGALVVAFAPRTRNKSARTVFTVDLPAGDSDLIVLLEDLHERDTTCFFSLRLLTGTGLHHGHPLSDPDGRVADGLATIRGLQVDRLFGTGESLSLVCDQPPGHDLSLTLTSLKQFERGGFLTMNPSRLTGPVAVMLPAGADGCTIDSGAEMPHGCVSLTVEAQVAGVRLERHMGTTLLPEAMDLNAPTLTERKVIAAVLMADAPANDPSTACLLLARNSGLAQAAQTVAETLITVEERHDCSDFNILPLLAIWKNHRTALPPALRDRLRSALLGYRYWLDAPGNDVMWFWSENHVLCFHTAQVLAGGLFPEDRFPNSGLKGADLAQAARVRLHRWFDAIAVNGLGEWNSSAYYPIDILALLSLHDHCGDDGLKARAITLLDRIFVMVALHTTGGVPAGSQGRSYEKESLAGYATELGSIAAVAFGGRFARGFDRVAALFCLSGYEPPHQTERLLRVPEGCSLRALYSQGVDGAGSLSLWKCADVQLSTTEVAEPGTMGHQQHLVDLQFAAHPMARVWINQPGDDHPWGARRPSFLAGNLCLPAVAQADTVALLIHDTDRPWNPHRFVNAYLPEAVIELSTQGHWTFLRCGAGYAALWCSALLTPVPSGPCSGSLRQTHADRTGWCLVAGSASLNGGFDKFRTACLRSDPGFDSVRAAVAFRGVDGPALELWFDGTFTKDGVEQNRTTRAPWPRVSVNNQAYVHWQEIGN